MRKTLLAAIIAATALVPPAALAQDRGHRGNRGGEGRSAETRTDNRTTARNWNGSQERTDSGTQRSWGGERGNRGGDGGQARTPRQPSAPQVQAAPQPQAQPRQWRGNNGGDNGNRGQWRGNNGGDSGQWRNRTPQTQPQTAPQQRRDWDNRGNRGDNRGNWNNNRNDNRGGWNNNNRNDNRWNNNRGWNGNDRGDRGRWNNSWRNNNRYDWRGFRNGNRNNFRLPRYYAPSGWGYGYRRFGIGFTLNSILFSSQYWINDPYAYRLPEVYGPYRWVRYYNDALLVDIYTGEVVDTVYDIFW